MRSYLQPTTIIDKLCGKPSGQKPYVKHSTGEIFGKARGTSSNGRALDSHSRGTGIDTPVLQLCFFEMTTIRIVGLLILVEIDS